MPVRSKTTGKRRTAAQRAASRRNLEKARAARQSNYIPTGKTVVLVHRTSAKSAEAILKQQKFKPRVWGYKKPEDIFFTPSSSYAGKKFYSGFGTGAVSVKVSRKLMKPDNYVEYHRYHAVTVDMKDLEGVKIKRYLA